MVKNKIKIKIKKPYLYKVIEEKLFYCTRYYIKHIKLNKPVGYLNTNPYNRQFNIIYYYDKDHADAECKYLNKNFPNN